jgi:hypothetical protein
MDELTHIDKKNIIIESREEQLYLIPECETSQNKNAILYCHENNHEYFIVNGIQIEIPHKIECSSIYALQYADLNDALKRYANEKISTSNCEIFKNVGVMLTEYFSNLPPKSKCKYP